MSAAIATGLPAAFFAIAALRAYPFVDDVSLPSSTPDDWHTYKQLALSVVRDGLSMPALATSYAGLPHGFLYIYFVAAIFAVAGVNSTYVYLVQSVVLGLSISLMYLVVRKRLTPAGGLTFLLTLTALMYVDVFRHLTFKLLSENLYFVLCPLLLILLFRSIEQTDRRLRDSLLAGAMLGLIVLARPSFILSAAMVIAAVWLWTIVKGQSSWPPALLLLGTAIGVSAVVARNYAVTGRATFDIVTNTSDWLRLWNLPAIELLIALVERSSVRIRMDRADRAGVSPAAVLDDPVASVDDLPGFQAATNDNRWNSGNYSSTSMSSVTSGQCCSSPPISPATAVAW